MIYSIGCSTLSLEEFQKYLHDYRIQYLFDVRSYPYSKMAPQTNKTNLEKFNRAGKPKCYYWVGDIMGGKPKVKIGSQWLPDPTVMTGDRYDYGKMAQKNSFKKGLASILRGHKAGYNICIMCSEAEPSICHRVREIGRELLINGVNMVNIRLNGLEPIDTKTLLFQLTNVDNINKIPFLLEVKKDEIKSIKAKAYVAYIGSLKYHETNPCYMECKRTYKGHIEPLNFDCSNKLILTPLQFIGKVYNDWHNKEKYDIHIKIVPTNNGYEFISACFKYGAHQYYFWNTRSNAKQIEAGTLVKNIAIDDSFTAEIVDNIELNNFISIDRSKYKDENEIKNKIDSLLKKYQWDISRKTSINYKKEPVTNLCYYCKQFGIIIYFNIIQTMDKWYINTKYSRNNYYNKTVNTNDRREAREIIFIDFEQEQFFPVDEEGKKFKCWIDQAGHINVRGTFTKQISDPFWGTGISTRIISTSDLSKLFHSLDSKDNSFTPVKRGSGNTYRSYEQDLDTYLASESEQKARTERQLLNMEQRMTDKLIEKTQKLIEEKNKLQEEEVTTKKETKTKKQRKSVKDWKEELQQLQTKIDNYYEK